MRQVKRQKKIVVKTDCVFCNKKLEPDYKNSLDLAVYLTDRGKIIPKSRSALCAKHQRRVSYEIKRARHLALLPFVAQV